MSLSQPVIAARSAALLALLIATLPANAAESVLAQHIANIEQGLLPAVTVQGAAPVKRKLAEEMARLGVPGVSIAVIHGGEVEWSKGYGVTQQGGAPVTPATLFQAASISKPVTAMAVLKLAESGAVALDADVNSYLGLWKLPKDADNSPVTLRQLLSHSAGTTVSGFPGYAAGAPLPTVTQILNGAAPANSRGVHVSTRPGSMTRYSGGGYTVVQQVLLERSRTPFAELLQQTVLKPLGMNDSSFEQPASAQLLARAALPHDASGKPVSGGPHTYPELAAAGLWTTPTDLAKFAIEVRRSAAGQSNKVLSQSMTNLMLSPVRDSFGLGLMLKDTGQSQSFAHTGGNAGYRNMMTAYTERGDGVVIMTNGDQGMEIVNQLVRSVAAEYNWPSLRARERGAIAPDAAAVRALPGSYTAKGLGDFTIARAGDGLSLSLGGGASEPLYASAGNTWFITSRDMEWTFDSNYNTGKAVAGTFSTAFERAK